MRISSYPDLLSIRDYLVIEFEKLDITAIVSTPTAGLRGGLIHLKRRHNHGRFAEVLIGSDSTIKIINNMPTVQDRVLIYHISDPNLFNKIILKARELLRESVKLGEYRHGQKRARKKTH